MRIYLKNNPVGFHPDPISNDGALGFLKSVATQEDKQKQQNMYLYNNYMGPVPG